MIFQERIFGVKAPRSRDPAGAGEFNFGIRPAYAGYRMRGRIRKAALLRS